MGQALLGRPELTHVWTPQPGPQALAFCSPVEDLFYGGQRGGGKTDFLLGDFARQERKYGGHAHGILFRRTYPELDEVVKRSRQLYSRVGWTYNDSKHIWTAPSGSTLKFRFLDHDKDANDYQGHQYTWIGFDEAEHWPNPEPLDLLWACLRSAVGVPCVRRLTGNPGGVGHHWLKQRYKSPAPPLVPHRYRPQPDTHPDLWITAVFVPARLEDNVLLMQNDPRYEERIAAATKGNAALWRAWRFGDWDVVAGAAFEEWNPDHHVQRFDPPGDWRWFGGVDWGYAKPCAVVFLAAGPEDLLVRSELYVSKQTPYEVGYLVGQKAKRFPQLEFLAGDSAMWAVTDGGPTVAEEFQRGLSAATAPNSLVLVSCAKGKGSRVVRKQLLHEHLRYSKGPDGTPNKWGGAKLRFHPDAVNTIRTIPALPIDPKNSEDIDTEAEDHAYDALTYALMARSPRPENLEVKSIPVDVLPPWSPALKRRVSRHPGEREEEALESQRGGYAGIRWGTARPSED